MVDLSQGKVLLARKPHVPQKRVVINISKADDSGKAMVIKTGIVSISDTEWRAWYLPLMKQGEENEVVMSSPGLSLDRARALAAKQGELMAFQVDLCLGQLVENAQRELTAKQTIDKAAQGG